MSYANVWVAEEQIRSLLDQSITRHYLSTLGQNGKICAEYVWIGGTGADLRSKARTLDFVPKDPKVRVLQRASTPPGAANHACAP